MSLYICLQDFAAVNFIGNGHYHLYGELATSCSLPFTGSVKGICVGLLDNVLLFLLQKRWASWTNLHFFLKCFIVIFCFSIFKWWVFKNCLPQRQPLWDCSFPSTMVCAIGFDVVALMCPQRRRRRLNIRCRLDGRVVRFGRLFTSSVWPLGHFNLPCWRVTL